MYKLVVRRPGGEAEVIRATGRTEIIAAVSRLFNSPDTYDEVVAYRGARPIFIIDQVGVRRVRRGGEPSER